MKKTKKFIREMTYMNEAIKIIIYVLIIFIVLSVTFWIGFEIGDGDCSGGTDGLYLGNRNKSSVKDYTKNKEPLGDWVCVNIREMSYERALEVCKHETFHEIFAECGEKKEPEECFNKYLDYKYKNEK